MGRKGNTVQAFWVGAGNLSALALGLVSAAILSRFLDKTEYGTYRQVIFIYNTLLVIFSAGLPRVFGYYLPRYNLAQGQDIVWKISKIMFLAGLVFSVFLFIFSGLIANLLKNPELSKGLKIFSPVPMLLLPTLGIEGIFSTYKKTVYVAVYNTLTRILMLLFIVLPVILFNGTYVYALYGWTLVSVITLILAYYFKGIPFKGSITEKSELSIREILKYSLPIAIAAMAGVIESSAIQFYISRYFGAKVFAEFSNGFIQIPFANMITGATAAILMPIFSKIIYDKSNIDELIRLWRTTLQRSVILIYPIVIFCIAYSKDIMVILFSTTYTDSAQFFSIAIIVNFFNVIMFTPLLLSLGESRFFARLQSSNAILSWLLGFFVVKIFNTPISLAIMSVVTTIIFIFIAFWFTSKRIKVPLNQLFPSGRILIITLHSVISLSVVKLLLFIFSPQFSMLLLFTLACVGYLFFLVLTSRWFKIDYREIIAPLLHKKSLQEAVIE